MLALVQRSKNDMQTEEKIAPAALTPVARIRLRRILAIAVIALGLGVTIAWMSFMGYGLFKLIEIAFLTVVSAQ